MHKFIGPSSVVLIGMFAILRLGEGEILFLWSLELFEFVDAVLRKQPTIMITNVRISTGSIRSIVDCPTLRRYCSISLHSNKIIIP